MPASSSIKPASRVQPTNSEQHGNNKQHKENNNNNNKKNKNNNSNKNNKKQQQQQQQCKWLVVLAGPCSFHRQSRLRSTCTCLVKQYAEEQE
ncbi:unnamed protein product [Polarella glacialis]|uniref:Uncharacterized protein n=1 Tax=Polarella glacialis TaxID=89957 RepID=A0A813FB91_POLGL|nr:unnamed protein product [Polarella glacialis]CAE8630821.1 unnamed protein product [Polarella glacialis]